MDTSLFWQVFYKSIQIANMITTLQFINIHFLEEHQNWLPLFNPIRYSRETLPNGYWPYQHYSGFQVHRDRDFTALGTSLEVPSWFNGVTTKSVFHRGSCYKSANQVRHDQARKRNVENAMPECCSLYLFENSDLV